MPELTPKQRQYLKGLAHGLSPVVRVGKEGLTDAVVKETRAALRAHELVKVRVGGEGAADRRALAGELTEAAKAHLVGTIGKVAILYRPKDDDPVIELP